MRPKPPHRPHILGIDDGPFVKGQAAPVPIAAALCEGADLLEAAAIGAFPVDGDGATEFLIDWLSRLRLRATVQAVALGGITLAGLGVVDVRRLAEALEVPVLVVTRRAPDNVRLRAALEAAGCGERFAIAERSPAAERTADGIWLAWAGTEGAHALALLEVSRAKAKLPEALRIAHLLATAIVRGESHGRV